MSPANGHANGAPTGGASAYPMFVPPSATNSASGPQFSPEQIRELTAALEAPFDPRVIEWRVTNTSKNGKPRGQVIPYADQRAYTDRLNALLSPAGWTRKYVVDTSANFERSKDQKMVAKVFVTCELTIFGLGSHSATGEEWADDENAVTSAEAQAFKRACCCFGLGRYLYYFSGEWIDLDDRKRPKSVPKLPKWATPEGWKQGLRPGQETRNNPPKQEPANGCGNARPRQPDQRDPAALVRQIEALEEPLGKGLYRGLLKRVARVWKPAEVRDVALLERLLVSMQAAKRGLERLDAALEITGPEALDPIFKELKVSSLDKVDNLDTLKQIVLGLEEVAKAGAERSPKADLAVGSINWIVLHYV